MLNEFMVLRRTLSEIGVPTKARHRDIATLGKGNALLRVFLKADGEVEHVEAISKTDAPKFWTFRDGKQNSFPRIGFKAALHGSLSDEEWLRVMNRRSTLDKRRTAFLELRDQHKSLVSDVIPWISASHRERISQRGETAKSSADPRAHLFFELTSAFLMTKDAHLIDQIDEQLADMIRAAPTEDLLTLGLKLCFLDAAKTEKPADTCDLFFDFESPFDFRRAADPSMLDVLSSGSTPTEDEKRIDGICALTGQPARIEDDKFPEANLPFLGPTYLHTRNRDIPSAARYRSAGPDSMPVSRELISELQAAAEELCSPAREGKTWTSVPSEKPKQADLLICYIVGGLDEAVASGMALDEAAFEELGERINQLSKGKNAYLPSDARIEICVLRKIDKANKKAVYTSALRLVTFRVASERWRLACRSGPAIILYLPPAKKGERVRTAEPRTLTPGRIVQLTRAVYIRDGSDSYQAAGITFADAFALIMRQEGGEQAFKQRVLRLVLKRGSPLLLGVGRANARFFKPDMEAIKPDARRDAVDVTSLLAGILFQMEINQGQTMNSPAYQLGQLLAGADVLHRGYCVDVRGGNLPPKLIGNAALGAAERNPAAALSQLLRRWRPYSGWATKRRRDDASLKQQIEIAAGKNDKKAENELRMIREGAWAPENLRLLAELLAATLTTERPKDVFRAQLFLGYVAGLPRLKESRKSIPKDP